MGACSGARVKDASAYGSNVAVEWYDLAYRLTRSEALSPPVAARAFAYMGVALYEGVVSGMPNNRSLAGMVNGELVVPPLERGVEYHWPMVAGSALATVMPAFYQKETSYLSIQNLFADQKEAALKTTSRDVITRSEDYGRSVGVATLRWALGDGYEAIRGCPYEPPLAPGAWVPTPPAMAKALEPCWGRLRPFVMSNVVQFRAPPPTTYSEDRSSLFFGENLEVYLTRNNLDAEQREIALYWADDPGRTGTPPGHSVALLTQLVVERQKSLDFAAEAYARAGMAVADAFISCWDTKYTYNLMRPVTYIKNWIDPDWMPLLNTPPFPEYTSGHSVQTAAMATVLEGMFGDGPFVDRVHESAGRKARSFDSFKQMMGETAISRLYAGIHYRPAIDVGVEQGTQIGKAVMALKLGK
jgi:hypothetical protein